MHYLRPAAVGLAVTLLTLAPAMAGGQKSAKHAAKTAESSPLNRVAFAVDGAESSHGADAAMWRPDPAGPEGPMQVSAAAASDVGGGDRFDLDQNRALGRAYLAALYRRYRNWPDAIAAYNWGIGHLNAWVKAGRPPDRVAAGVVAYLQRVMRDSGLCPAPHRTGRARMRRPPRLAGWPTRRGIVAVGIRDPAQSGAATGDAARRIVSMIGGGQSSVPSAKRNSSSAARKARIHNSRSSAMLDRIAVDKDSFSSFGCPGIISLLLWLSACARRARPPLSPAGKNRTRGATPCDRAIFCRPGGRSVRFCDAERKKSRRRWHFCNHTLRIKGPPAGPAARLF